MNTKTADELEEKLKKYDERSEILDKNFNSGLESLKIISTIDDYFHKLLEEFIFTEDFQDDIKIKICQRLITINDQEKSKIFDALNKKLDKSHNIN